MLLVLRGLLAIFVLLSKFEKEDELLMRSIDTGFANSAPIFEVIAFGVSVFFDDDDEVFLMLVLYIRKCI